MALKFGSVVIAILSLDLLVQVKFHCAFLFSQNALTHSSLQFRWGTPGKFEIKNNVIDNFDNFVETTCKWIKMKIFPLVSKAYVDDESFGDRKVSKGEYATKVVRGWNEIFCGFGAYSVQEVFFRAGLFHPLTPKGFGSTRHSGLSPFLTTLEVFTNPSRVGRLLLAMRQFATFDIEDLWYSLSLMAG